MKALDEYFLTVAFTFLLDRVHVFVNFMFNLNVAHVCCCCSALRVFVSSVTSLQCDAGVGMHILYEHIHQKPQKIMLLGAAFSTVSQPIADTAKYWNLIQVMSNT